MSLTAVAGLAGTLLALVADEAPPTSAAPTTGDPLGQNTLPLQERGGVPRTCCQFPVAEEAITALGFVLWPMVEWRRRRSRDGRVALGGRAG